MVEDLNTVPSAAPLRMFSVHLSPLKIMYGGTLSPIALTHAISVVIGDLPAVILYVCWCL